MFQNIKVDIIYYKTNTDFEMEFNLSGCCRMRLLTDKSPDRKILVSQLARAVSRSRIIIIAGSLFGEDGVIKTAASAIGKSMIKVDNQQFGITSNDEIEIIKDAIPLVNEEGIFGGCIIEQGPQTLILLSDNKNLRKRIMQTLIHPYIQEVCAAEMTEKTEEPIVEEIDEQAEVTEEVESELIIEDESVEDVDEDISEAESVADKNIVAPLSDSELIVDDATESGEELILAEADVYSDDKKLSDEMVLEDEDYLDDVAKLDDEIASKTQTDAEELIFEPEYFNRRKGNRMTMEYAYTGTDADEYITGEEEDEEVEHPFFVGRGINVPIIVVAVLLVFVILVLCYCVFIVPMNEGVTTGEYLTEAFEGLFG